MAPKKEILKKILVKKSQDGMRLDKFLTLIFRNRSRSYFKDIISLIKTTGYGKVKPSMPVHTGMVITVPVFLDDEIIPDADYKVAYEDDYIYVINKDPGIPVHPSGRYYTSTVVQMIQQRTGKKVFPVNRIDKDTSGLFILGKTSEACGKFSKNIKFMEKEYIAIIHGKIKEKHGFIKKRIAIDSKAKVRLKMAIDEEKGKEAITEFFLLSYFKDYSLLKLKLHTGRQHQIRVHLQSLGHPIVGDKIYGLKEEYFLAYIEKRMTEKMLDELEMYRHALHSFRLKMPHPYLNITIKVKAPLPYDMIDFIKGKKSI